MKGRTVWEKTLSRRLTLATYVLVDPIVKCSLARGKRVPSETCTEANVSERCVSMVSTFLISKGENLVTGRAVK